MSGVETEIVTDAQRSHLNEQANSVSTYQNNACKNQTQLSSDLLGTGMKNNEIQLIQNKSNSKRNYGSSYSHKRNDNETLIQQL